MLQRIVNELGPWNWIVLGFILLLLELMLPGVFFLWIGVAALIVGTIAVLVGSAAGFAWQMQIVLFLVLAVVTALAGRKLIGARDSVTDEPLLNKRGEQLVGRYATLEEPIVNGRGRARIGDTTWRINGADAPAGTRVRVTGFDQGALTIEPLDDKAG
ncbi:MAG: NfeD family protein [Phyllobacterium sp.]